MGMRSLALRTYFRAPETMQRLLFQIEGARIAYERYGGQYPSIFQAVAARDYWEHAQILEFQNLRLSSFLRNMSDTIPHIEDELRATGTSVADITPQSARDVLSTFPIITKDGIKRAPASFRSHLSDRSKSITTGGTAGNPLTFVTTRSALQEQWAVWWRYRLRFGITRDVRAAHFGGKAIIQEKSPVVWRNNKPGNLVYFSANHLRRSTIETYVAKLNRIQAPWIHGYPTVLVRLAEEIAEKGLSLDIPVTWVTTGAERLDESASDLLAEVFGVKPRQHYGLAEAVANFSECTLGMLHVDEDYSFVEFLSDSHTPYRRIVGTAYTNTAMGFVRYDTGDLAILPKEECNCGHPGRSVVAVLGRGRDFIELGSGSLLGPVNQIAKEVPWITSLQLEKTGPYDLVAYVVPRGGSDAAVSRVSQLIHARADVDVQVRVVRVEEPVRTKLGKAPSVLPYTR